MTLTLAIHPISDVTFGVGTELVGTRLQIDKDELIRRILGDRRLSGVDIEIAKPGDSFRAGIIADVVEPRAKEPGDGSDFPGVIGKQAIAGLGTTHVLRGAAVSLVDDGAPALTGRMLEMSGPAAEASAYGGLQHVVIAPHAVAEIPRHTAQNAYRIAMLQTAVFMAQASVGQSAATTEVIDLVGPRVPGREGLPRVAYIAQIYGHQMIAEPDEQILYGSNTAGMVPVPLHPAEWLDGAVVTSSNFNMSVETFFYQNHPLILDLYRRHQAGELTFVGTIATVAASDEVDRNRNCMVAAHTAKQVLGADGVVLTKYGGGAPHADMGLTAHLCEEMGMRTTVQVSDAARDRRAESALLFSYDDVDAIVYGGGNDMKWSVPAAERVLAGSADAADALGAPQELGAASVVGVVNQQGSSRLRAVVY
jgi:sarcosine reductase